ncbi:hypothetical protein B0T26DRAFT_712063 [Lasiosphaeria miniovina]|uniref:Uncharacterized protein n=1 Tax=Lasiosphaeria miniovina TaxID=1954250 RepID=A0AA40ALS2_9PEZI|nr:uncharacterized protein B0T26DRAFT_712063 [Lasiosphaeria miniovina]KAK0718154.1 hypothetical protein B0T26DRAFT_712063 [Lasiosphaeria miniovina]
MRRILEVLRLSSLGIVGSSCADLAVLDTSFWPRYPSSAFALRWLVERMELAASATQSRHCRERDGSGVEKRRPDGMGMGWSDVVVGNGWIVQHGP